MKIKGPVVLLDGNHPLAGKALRFSCKVTELRAASEKKLPTATCTAAMATTTKPRERAPWYVVASLGLYLGLAPQCLRLRPLSQLQPALGRVVGTARLRKGCGFQPLQQPPPGGFLLVEYLKKRAACARKTMVSDTYLSEIICNAALIALFF